MDDKVPGPALAFPRGESSSQHESVNETGVQHETSIYSWLVSHSACAPSLDDIPIRPICAVAGALVGFSLCVAVAVEDLIHENVFYQFEQTLRRGASDRYKARRGSGFRGIGSSSQAEGSRSSTTHYE